jgi:SAM-dependent methyltransferase
MTDSWMLDELAHAGAEHLDPAYIAGYERKSGYDGRDGDDLLDDLAVFDTHGATGTLVDLGAGTGRLAIAAARRFRQVIAVDVSPAMLEYMSDRAAEVPRGLPNLELVRGGFLSYRHAGPPADGVYSRNALHQVPDFWKAIALTRIAAMLRPGGVLRLRDLIFDCPPAQAGDLIERWLDGAVSDPARGYTRDDFVQHLRTEYSTFRWLFEPMLSAAGFEIVSADFRGSIYAAYTCVRL